MSFSSLGIGASALTAAQRAMETAAHNVANVNTEGYTRQRVELRAADPVPGIFGKRGDGMRGMGVTIADVIRVRSSLVDANYRAQASTEAAWSARAEVMGRAEQVLGPFGEGAPAALAEFWAGWEELSLHPDNPAARRGVLDAGGSLARSLRSAASQLDQLAGDTAAQVREEVGEVNRLAGQIARLNAGIADATAGAQAPNDLLDERDRLLDRLSALTGATFRPSDLGRVDVFLGSMALVRGESVETLHASDGVPATLGWSPGGIDNLTVGGRLGALVDAGRTTLPGLQTELDTFANDLAQLVNGHHADGWDGRQPPQAGGPT
jgi:flagellar hook-associated protein 1 FlgK